MASAVSIIDELEAALTTGTNDQRIQTLSRITDLFVTGGDSYSEDQIGLFDDVMMRIVARIEAKAMAKLSSRLATLPNAPRQTVRNLALHDDIAIARPVLTHSDRLDEKDLVAGAKTKGDQHLLAISARRDLSEAVTDVLVERGSQEVVRTVVKNAGARFSDAGFRTIVNRANGDDALAFAVGLRRDTPRPHLIKLIEKASSTVRDRLTALNPQAATVVREIVSEVAGGLRGEMRNASNDHAAAKAAVANLHRSGQLNENTIYVFARERKFEETVAALALICGVEADVVERALLDPSGEVSLILARFAGVSWTTAKAILLLQAADRGISAQDLDKAMHNFTRLQPDTAARVLSFYRTRRKAMAEA